MFLSPYSLTPMHLHGAEVGRGTGREWGEVVVGNKAQTQTQFWRCAHRNVNTLQKEALELDVKSPELTQKGSVKHTCLSRRTQYINTGKQTHTGKHPELSSLTVSPRCITLSGMQEGGSPQQAHYNAQSQERRRGVFLPPERVAGKLFV